MPQKPHKPKSGYEDETPITDEQLREAVEQLRGYILHDVAKMLRRCAVRPLRREIAEAVEYAFEEAAIRRPGHPRPTAWLTTVAYRTAIKLALKRRREDEVVAFVAELPEDKMYRGEPSPVELTVETIDVLDAVSRLPERQRIALGLDTGGYSHTEIAERMQLTRSEVGQLVRAARATLREQFRA